MKTLKIKKSQLKKAFLYRMIHHDFDIEKLLYTL